MREYLVSPWDFSVRVVKAARLGRLIMAGVAVLCPLTLLCGQQPASKPHTDSGSAQATQNTTSAKPTPGEYVLSPDSNVLSQPAPQEYMISPEDQLDVYVLDAPELSRPYRVSQTGLIDVPLLKEPILAAGLTTAQLSETIGEKLRAAGMIDNPHVTVQILQSRFHAVTVAGAVKTPQIYPVLGKTTLLDVLSQAGGLADDAGNTVIVARGDVAKLVLGREKGSEAHAATEPNSPSAVKVDLKRLMEGDASLNLTLYPGDRVTVQRAGIVYVVGAVNTSGGFVLSNDREQMTVLKAIALAQNIKSTAIPRKSMIIRKNPNAPDGTQQIPLDLGKILKGKQPDQKLLANDILFVPDSTSKKALHRAGEAAAQAASLVVYRVPL